AVGRAAGAAARPVLRAAEAAARARAVLAHEALRVERVVPRVEVGAGRRDAEFLGEPGNVDLTEVPLLRADDEDLPHPPEILRAQPVVPRVRDQADGGGTRRAPARRRARALRAPRTGAWRHGRSRARRRQPGSSPPSPAGSGR